MSKLSEFFALFFDEWGKFAKRMDLIEVWSYLIDESRKNSEIGQKCEELMNYAKDCFQNKKLNSLLTKPVVDYPFDAPFFSGDDAARQNLYRWSNGQATIKEAFLLSFVVLLCLFMQKDKKYFNKFKTDEGEYPFESLEEFPSNTIILHISTSIGFDNEAYLGRILTDEKYRFPFLLASLFTFRDLQKGENKKSLSVNNEKDKNVSEWLESVYNEINNISKDIELTNFHKEYVKNLWSACKTIDVRDMVGAKLSSINENVQISNLYIVPPFSKNGTPIDTPVDSSKRISQLYIANTGCGKSTFLQAVVTSNIINQLSVFGIERINDADLSQYNDIKKRFGFDKDFFPVLVKAGDINSHCVDEGIQLLDIAIGSKTKGYSDLINRLLDRFKRTNQIILLIDALDEIEDSERKRYFSRLIDQFLADYPSANIIITSRAIDLRDFYESTFYGTLERISLGLLGEPEIRELISKWMLCDTSLSTEQDVEKKFKYFINNEYLSKLAPNPYMLSHALHYQAHHVNATPQEIISHVIDNLIEKRWPTAEYQKLGITPSYMREILSRIAWEMVESDDHVVSTSAIIPRFSAAADSIEGDIAIDKKTWATIVKEMNARAGLLILEDVGYVFQNNIIEYFLASEWAIAKYVDEFCNGTTPEPVILCRIAEDFQHFEEQYWADVILMMFSPDARYNLHRRDSITPALFKYLLYKSAESVSHNELTVLGRVLLGLVNNTFGRNRITNTSNSGGILARKQITRILFNNDILLKNTSTWKENSPYKEILKELSDDNLIDYKEDNNNE